MWVRRQHIEGVVWCFVLTFPSLSLALCSGFGRTVFGTNWAAASAIGIVAAGLALILSALALAWLLVEELFGAAILRFILLIGFVVTAVHAMISGIMYCSIVGPLGPGSTIQNVAIAACVFQWVLFLLCGVSAFLVLMTYESSMSSKSANFEGQRARMDM